MKPIQQKTNSNLISRWLGRSSFSSSGAAPLQLMALEDRVLYSAGPVPVEVISAGAELLSQGELQDVSATDLGIAPVEVDGISTIDDLIEQIDAVHFPDSISDIQPLEGIVGSNGFGMINDLVDGISESQSINNEAQATAISLDSAIVEIPLDERVAAANSNFATQLPDFLSSQTTFQSPENREFVANLEGTPVGEVFFRIVGGDDATLFTFISGTDEGLLNFITPPDFDNPGDSDGDGLYSVVIRVENEQGVGTDREFTIQVTDVVNAPQDLPADFSSQQFEFESPENRRFAVDLQSFDPEGATTFYTIVGGADQDLFEITPITGIIEFLSTPDFENPSDFNGDNIYELDIIVEDGSGFGSLRSFTIEVTDVIDANQNQPAFFTTVGSEFTAPENSTFVVDLESDDPEGLAVTYSIVGGDDAAEFGITNFGAINFLTPQDFENPGDFDGDGFYSVTVRVEDPSGLGEERDLLIELTDANEVAVLSSTDFVTFENQSTTHTINAIAGDGSNFEFTVDEDALDEGAFTFISIGNNFQFVIDPLPDFENSSDANGDGIYEFILTATSDTGFTTTETIRVAVMDMFEMATLPVTDFSQEENVFETHQLNASAADGSTFTYQLLDGNDSDLISLDENTGVFSLNAIPDFENEADADSNNVYTFSVLASTDTGFSVQRDINLVVTDVDQQAVTLDDSVTLTSIDGITRIPIESLTINDMFFDLNLDEFELQIVDRPLRGSVTVSGGFVEFTPSVNFGVLDTDAFSYQLVSADGTIRSDVATVDVDSLDLPPNSFEEENDEENDRDSDDGFDGTGMNLTTLEDDDESDIGRIGRVQAVPAAIEFGEDKQQAVIEALDSQFEDAKAGLLLDYESNVYSYFGRTQFLDLSNQELSAVSSVEAIQDITNFNNQLMLSQFVVGADAQDTSSSLDLSNLDLGVFRPFSIGVGAITVAIASLVTLTTSSQIPRVLDFGQMLDEESIEEIVSS